MQMASCILTALTELGTLPFPNFHSITKWLNLQIAALNNFEHEILTFAVLNVIKQIYKAKNVSNTQKSNSEKA